LQARAHGLRRPLHANELRRFPNLQTRAAALQTWFHTIASATEQLIYLDTLVGKKTCFADRWHALR
jgi:hypothetical protein